MNRLFPPEQAANEKYRLDPAGYVRDVLGVKWWAKQIEIAEALVKYKRVMVKSGHSLGKSHMVGGLVAWFMECYRDSVVITTAPTKDSVVDVLWREIRSQLPKSLRPYIMPRSPRIQVTDDHFAVGYTASTGGGFQGRKAPAIFLIYDECVDIEALYWQAGDGMMTGEIAYWLACCNPTDTTSEAYNQAVNTDRWHVIEISCLEHPNIPAQIAGHAPEIPGAVTVPWIEDKLRTWFDRIAAEDHGPGDVEFPPGSGAWYRPGPLGESRVLGRWPATGGTAVWTEAVWQQCLIGQPIPDDPIEIGCDRARFGDDFTSILVRKGACSLHHETHNGWSGPQVTGRLKQLCREFAKKFNPTLTDDKVGLIAKSVRCKIDDLHGGVVDNADGYSFIEVKSAATAIEEEGYPNKRSELWFVTADRAAKGRIDLSRLTEESKQLLRRQALAPTWKADGQGRRVVEPKADTKKRIGRSPDDMDGMNLAYYGAGSWAEAVAAMRNAQAGRLATGEDMMRERM